MLHRMVANSTCLRLAVQQLSVHSAGPRAVDHFGAGTERPGQA